MSDNDNVSICKRAQGVNKIGKATHKNNECKQYDILLLLILITLIDRQANVDNQYNHILNGVIL